MKYCYNCGLISFFFFSKILLIINGTSLEFRLLPELYSQQYYPPNTTSQVYFISRLFASVLQNAIDALQLSETAPIVFTKHDGTQSSSI